MRSLRDISRDQFDELQSSHPITNCAPRERKRLGEPFGRPALLAAADAERHDPALDPVGREPCHGHHVFRAEVPHGIQDPPGLYRRTLRCLAHCLEDRCELLTFPQNHAGRERNFRIADVLGFEPLQQPARGQSIIGGRPEALAHSAESQQEAIEIFVIVHRAQFLDRRGGVQFVQRFRLHRPFQVQMQLRFRHFQQEIGHTAIRHDC
jgi:hypothetical protein